MKTPFLVLFTGALIIASATFTHASSQEPQGRADCINIQAHAHCVTLVSVFTCTREQQQPLIDTLIDGTDHIMAALPGFIASSVHRSADGKHVINYAQWTSAEAIAAMRQNPAVKAYILRLVPLGKFESTICDVVGVNAEPNAELILKSRGVRDGN